MNGSRSSFTLIELLIVIAIVAILSVVVVLVLNPAELLKQSRDVDRLSDLNVLSHALSLYQTDVIGGSLGTPSTAYLSIIDPTATSTAGTNCGGVGIGVPANWTYHCAASSTQKKVDGTGWLPLNFRSISYGSPLGTLPTDPTNTSSSSLYYMYTPSPSGWALTAMTESQKYLTTSNNDGGYDPARFEVGSIPSLTAQSEGLVGWWPMDEGTGITAADHSGNGNDGTLTNGPTWTAGKVGGAVQLDGTNYVSAGTPASLSITGPFSVTAWVKRDQPTDFERIGGRYYWNVSGSGAWAIDGGQGYLRCYTNINGTFSEADSPAGSFNQTSTWYMIGCVYNGSRVVNFLNGAQQSASGIAAGTVVTSTYPMTIGTTSNGLSGQNYFHGAFDDFRIYNRALTASEIAAIYNAAR